MKKQAKPEWITDEQWEANPNVYHWEQSREAMQSLNQSQEQQTHEEIVAHQRKMLVDAGISTKDYENFLNEQKPMERL